MPPGKAKQQSMLQELIVSAREFGIEVRTEKLLREVGYRARSGRCRLNGKNLVILDRDAPLADQVDFLAGVIAERRAK